MRGRRGARRALRGRLSRDHVLSSGGRGGRTTRALGGAPPAAGGRDHRRLRGARRGGPEGDVHPQLSRGAHLHDAPGCSRPRRPGPGRGPPGLPFRGRARDGRWGPSASLSSSCRFRRRSRRWWRECSSTERTTSCLQSSGAFTTHRRVTRACRRIRRRRRTLEMAGTQQWMQTPTVTVQPSRSEDNERTCGDEIDEVERGLRSCRNDRGGDGHRSGSRYHPGYNEHVGSLPPSRSRRRDERQHQQH